MLFHGAHTEGVKRLVAPSLNKRVRGRGHKRGEPTKSYARSTDGNFMIPSPKLSLLNELLIISSPSQQDGANS